jgi:hypothetical protein
MPNRPRQSPVIMMSIAFPPDVRGWIEEKADHGLVPMNAIIVATLRRQMAADQRHEASFDQDLVGGGD